MESASFPVSNVRQTRLQVANEKRIADEQLKQKAELKRRKKMFAPRKVIGPRDILVNSNLQKIKLEEDVGSSSIVKKETKEVEPTSMENFSFNNQFIQPCANSADNAVVDVGQNVNARHADEESKDNLSSIMSIKSEDNQVLQKHVELLKVLVDQKDQEINVLSEVVERLQLHLTDLKKISVKIVDDPEIDDGTLAIETGILNLPGDKQVAQLTSDLTSKDIRIKMLTTTMIKLQNELLDNTNNSFQSTKDSRTSEKIVQETFKQVLPFLYHEFALKDLLACRGVCQLWQNTVDTYLSNHPSKNPFKTETHLKEFQRLEIGPIPKWNESPLTQLEKIYRFSNMEALENFTKTRKGIIIGSTVRLDYIILAAQLDDLSTLNQFLDYFGSKINYIGIRQCVGMSNLELLMDRIKLCLGKLPNLKEFNLVFCIDPVEIQRQSGWRPFEWTKKVTHQNWQTNSFPKLESLESLVLDVEINEGWSVHANFLRNFSKSLIKPYQKQLRRVSMFAHEIGPSEGLIMANLVQLAIPQRYLGQNAKFGCESVEKCTMTSCVYLLTHDIILVIQKLFPKLVSLGFRFEYVGGKLENLYWTPFAPKLQDLIILELENCGGVVFNVLSCFPNVRYIKLINKYSDDVQVINDDNVLNITKLWQGDDLYESRSFWDTFPGIFVVTLEFNREPSKMYKTKISTWTRDGYNQYWHKLKFDDFLQSIL